MASALPSTVQRKRAQASFPRRELHILLNGGPSHAALKEAVDAQLSRDEVFQSGPARVNASREEERQASAKVVTRLIQYLRQDDEETAQVRDRLMALAYPGAHSRISNHRDLFAPAIRGLGSAEQVQQWEPALRDFGVIGCFCMTELGHGSYARGIETTATYMPDTDQFDIHTPNETSAKVWIGSAGKTATHGVVFAQLVVAGKVLGLNAFIVPLRDMATGAALPGITAGDMGSKMGRNALDNGILWFSHVKVPRSALLCRYTKVDRQGGVTVSPLQQLSFFALVGGRIMMTHASSGYLSMATTIAVRYLAARRQFPAQDEPAPEQAQTHQLDPPPATGSGEAVVLDYPIQSRKMARMLARSVALHATGWALERVHEEVTATLAAAVRGTSNMSPAISALKMLHNLSAALKASTTWAACDGIDTCRQACGGVGYSSYSGLPGIQADMAVMPTWEGDNTLMCLQAGGFLLKGLRALSKGAEPSPALTWLPEALAQDTPFPESAAEYRLCKASTHEDIIQFVQRCVSGLRWCAAQGATALASKLSRAELSPAEAAEDMVPMALAFADAFSVNALCEWAQDPAVKGAQGYWQRWRAARGLGSEATFQVGTETKLLLLRLAAIFATDCIHRAAASFVGHVPLCTWESLHCSQQSLADCVRHDLVAACDAFGHSDFVLCSAVGGFAGQVYEKYLAAIRGAPGFAGPQQHPAWGETFGAALSSSAMQAKL